MQIQRAFDPIAISVDVPRVPNEIHWGKIFSKDAVLF